MTRSGLSEHVRTTDTAQSRVDGGSSSARPAANPTGRSDPALALAIGVLEATDGETCLVDREGMIVATNSRWRAFGVDNGGLDCRRGVGTNYLAVLAAADESDADCSSWWRTQLVSVLAGELEGFEFDYRCDAPGRPRWYTARVRRVANFGACISHHDMTGTRSARLALEHALRHDPSTQLPNRQAMEAVVTELVAAARAVGSAVTVAVIDLEGVDRVAEGLGRATGDDLLIDVAARLGGCLTGRATLGRFAADTFMVVWEGVEGASEAIDRAQGLLRGLRQPFAVSDGYVDVTASIGVVFDRWPVETSHELIVNAESAMRRARTAGGAQTHLFTADLRAGAADRWLLEREIRTGIERDEFTLHYQPVVDLLRREVIGVEALIRWQHPSGLRMPDSFIAVAESTGLIVPLGEWVLNEACRQGAAWADQGHDLRVAVNFSAQQIGDAGVVRAIDEALATTGMRGERLLVEVTESTVLEHAERTLRVLDQIRARGIDVAIDDFGTGYSSLLYLKRYPIQGIKVDRQFVAGLGTTTEDDAIVAGVIAFARAVGASCIAEGVETPLQYDLLQGLRCRFAQGYLFSAPVPAPEVPDAADACRAALVRLSDRLPSTSMSSTTSMSTSTSTSTTTDAGAHR